LCHLEKARENNQAKCLPDFGTFFTQSLVIFFCVLSLPLYHTIPNMQKMSTSLFLTTPQQIWEEYHPPARLSDKGSVCVNVRKQGDHALVRKKEAKKQMQVDKKKKSRARLL
jgi:hypothetical protein